MKLNPDLINCLFQVGCAAFEWYDIYILRRDKAVRGVHWSTLAFLIAWNSWGLRYYTVLHQWWSLFGTCVLLLTGLWWLKLLIKYRRKSE